MIANYHTHTFRCGHATGEDEEYILQAIEAGFKELGFSDHAPFMFPDGRQSCHRIKLDMAQDYIDKLSALREKYRDKINIHIGFEMEFYPLFFNDMFAYAKNLGAEYLILGQHYTKSEQAGYAWSLGDGNTYETLKEYVDCVICAIESGKFSYVAHPDCCKYDISKAEYYDEMKRLCITAKEYDVPLEINLFGLAEGRNYPNEKFWEIAGEIGCKAIIGSDAHSPSKVYNYDIVKAAENIVKENSIILLETLKIKQI